MRFFGLCIVAAVLLASCESLFEPTGPGKVTLDYELPKVQKDQVESKDKTLNYKPGFVTKLVPESVVVDSKTGALFVKDEYIVVLRPNKTDKDLARDLRVAGIDARLLGYLPTIGLVQLHCEALDADKRAKIMTLKSVEDLQIHYAKESNQAGPKNAQREANQWPIYKFAIPSLWSISKGSGQTIAVVDTGIDDSLKEFQGRIVDPYSVVTLSSKFEDRQYTAKKSVLRVIDHGTTVAFVAAGLEDASQKAAGIAPEAKIMPVQVFGYSLYQDKILTNDLMVVEGILRSIAYGATIINLSLGIDYSAVIAKTKDPNQRAALLNEMFEISENARVVYGRALSEANKRGILVVVAGGNDGVRDANVQPLSGGDGVISAGSINNNGVISAFSNAGDFIDCYAPGENLLCLTTGENLVSRSGTSYSAPYVAGVLAIMRSYNPNLTPSQLKLALKKTNFSFRSSILDASERPLFSPSRLMAELNPKFVIDDKSIRDFLKFEKLYSRYFVIKADKDLDVYDKIVGYYSARGTFNRNEPEWQRGIQIAKPNANILIPKISNDYRSYYSAQLLSDARVSSPNLELAAANLLKSDFLSFVLADSRYAQLAAVCEKRLRERPFDFNLNTLGNFDQAANASNRVAVYRFMFDKINSLKYKDISTLAPVLHYLAKATDQSDTTNTDLIKKSCGESIKHILDAGYYLENRYIKFLVDAGIAVKYEPILPFCLDYIDYLEKNIASQISRNDPQLNEVIERNQAALGDFADSLNSALPYELKYYPFDSDEAKREKIPLIRDFLKSFVWQ